MEIVDCIIWDVDPMAFHIGSIGFKWYGIFCGLFFLFGLWSLDWQFKRAGLPDESAFRLLVSIFIGSILGAFVAHRLFYEWQTLINDPLSLFDFSKGLTGLSSHGALVGCFGVLYIYSLISKIKFIELLDRITFGGAIGTILVRLGNLMNSEVIGKPSDMPWAFCFTQIDGRIMTIPRHPTQIYDALTGCAILGLLFWLDWQQGKEKRPLGLLSAVFLVALFTMRSCVEFFKEHQALSSSFPLTMGQLLSIPCIALGIAMLIWSRKNSPARQPVK